jgi:hypothetical protein
LISRNWVGETAFIIAGGPSVKTQPVDLLKGRKVILINSSYERAPWGDLLFFHDFIWWRHHREKVTKVFGGTIYTNCAGVKNPQVNRLTNSRPPRKSDVPLKLSDDPRAVPVRRTSLSGALNIAVHKGCESIVILGADGKLGPGGERNHHSPHDRKLRPDPWMRQYRDLTPIAAELRARGVRVLNASPGSAWDLWPTIDLNDGIPD